MKKCGKSDSTIDEDIPLQLLMESFEEIAQQRSLRIKVVNFVLTTMDSVKNDLYEEILSFLGFEPIL